VKKLIMIAVLLLAAVTGAFAQAGAITDYMFGLPGENYMEVQWYPESGFEKFYVQAGFTGKADLGFATKIGGIYVGVSYTGGIFNQYNWNYEESVVSFRGADKKIKQYKTPDDWYKGTDDPYDPNIIYPFERPVDHNLGILVGIADMGFRFDFGSDYQLFEVKEDVVVDGGQYKSYRTEYGNITPSLKFGMAKDLTPNGIRPSVQLSLGFHVDQSQTEQYNDSSPYTKRAVNIKNAEGINNGTDNYTDLGLALNLGGYTFMSRKNLFTKENEFSFSVDLDYSLNSKLYGKNQYTYSNIDATAYTFEKEGRFGDTNTAFDTNIKNGTHVIEPSVQVQWNVDKIGLGAKLHLPVTIGFDESTTNLITYGTTSYSIKETATTKETSIEFAPRLNLGGVYRLVISKFHINMGAEIGLSSAESKTVEVSPKDDSSKKTISVTNETNGTHSQFTIGASLFLTRNVILDAYTGVRDRRDLNFFGTGEGSVTYFGGILLMLSF